MPQYKTDYERMSLDIDFGDTKLEFNLEDCPSDIKDRLALHGAVQLVAAAANRADDHESAFEFADDAILYINESFPCKRPAGEPREIVIRAIAQLKKWPLDQASRTWSELSLKKQESVRKKKRLIDQIELIRAERAYQYLSEPAPTRKKHYTHEILPGKRKAVLHFANGKDLEINLDNVSSVPALAVSGAKQKVADSYAAERIPQKQIESARQMIRALYMGCWTAKNAGIEADSPTGFVPELVPRLVEWMQWPRSTVESVVRQFDEEEQAKLLSTGAKQVLANYVRETGLEPKPSAPSPGEMWNILDEVIDRLGVASSENHEGLHQ